MFDEFGFHMNPVGAFEPRPDGGMRMHGGGKGGSSAPPPDPRLVKAQIKSLGVQDAAVEKVMALSDMMQPYQMEQLIFGVEQQKRLAPLQEEQLQLGLRSANTAYEQSQQDREWALKKRGQLDRAQADLIEDAASFNEEDRRDALYGQSAADITQAFDGAEGQAMRSMTRMGVNPNDGKMAAMVQQNNLQEALAKASAGRAASDAARAEGMQLKSNAANMLSGYPSMGMQASSAGAGFGGMGLTVANNGLAGAGSAMNFVNAGLQGMGAGYGQASQMAGQMGSNATSMFNAQANYKNTQDQIAAAYDPFATLIGAGAQIGAAWAGKPSDRRLKENIELVGRDERTGLSLYEFNYIDMPTRRFRGVMADEVEKLYPDAVMTMEDGFKAVHYAALGMEMVEAPGENA